MSIGFILEVIKNNQEKEAIIWRDKTYTYGWMLENYIKWKKEFDDKNIIKSVVALDGDFSPNTIPLLLTIIENKNIVVPLTATVKSKSGEFYDIAQVEIIVRIDENDNIIINNTGRSAINKLITKLKSSEQAGLILFSSGSTGKSKGIVQNLDSLLEKFKVSRHSKRSITFLLFDHIGGINTLFYTLSNAGTLITVPNRSPETVCQAIQDYRAEILPTSPSFLNLLLLSEVYKLYDLSSLELITYGTEVMPESTLKRIHELFPNIKLLQTYGLSEVGILRSKSKASNSLWMKVGGEGIELRVVKGILQIKTPSAMVGYLNAPSPFTEDGWFDTGDAVEVDGDYVKILGRDSDIINVGGEKVYPVEVEGIIQMMPGVEEVAITGVSNPFTGQMVQAAVKVNTGESLKEFRVRMREFCKDKLTSFKIPQKVILTTQSLHGERFKKKRLTITN